MDRNNPKGAASQAYQFDPDPQRGRVEESGTSDQEVRPASLNGSTTEDLKLTEETNSTSPVHDTFEDISVVHSAVTNEMKKTLAQRGAWLVRWVCPMRLSHGEG